jgi:hypothetical protein
MMDGWMHWRERQAKKIKKNQMNNILPPPKKEKILVFVFKGELIINYYSLFNF